MSPLVLASLVSMAPGLLSKLFGGDPQAKLRREINRLLGSQEKTGERYYQQALGSPAYSQALGSIAAGANQAGSQLASQMGARGIGTSGTSAVMSSMIPSLVGSQQAGLRTQAYDLAQNQAQQEIQAKINALLGTSGPSQTQEAFGAGLNQLGPIFQMWLKSKYPKMFGGQ